MVGEGSVSNRGDPKRIGSDQIHPFNFAQLSQPIDTLLPYLTIINGDSVPHTLTFTIRGAGNATAITCAPTIAAGQSVSYPTLPFAAVALDSGGTGSSVVGFYTDVPVLGPKSAAGSGAATVSSDFESFVTPLSGGTPQMAGLGSVLTLTPKISGRIQITVTVNFDQTAAGNCYAIVRYGTGAPPALNAAVTGTGANIAVQRVVSVGEVSANDVLTLSGVIPNVFPLGIPIWVDLAVQSSVVATNVIFIEVGSLQELPS